MYHTSKICERRTNYKWRDFIYTPRIKLPTIAIVYLHRKMFMWNNVPRWQQRLKTYFFVYTSRSRKHIQKGIDRIITKFMTNYVESRWQQKYKITSQNNSTPPPPPPPDHSIIPFHTGHNKNQQSHKISGITDSFAVSCETLLILLVQLYNDQKNIFMQGPDLARRVAFQTLSINNAPRPRRANTDRQSGTAISRLRFTIVYYSAKCTIAFRNCQSRVHWSLSFECCDISA